MEEGRYIRQRSDMIVYVLNQGLYLWKDLLVSLGLLHLLHLLLCQLLFFLYLTLAVLADMLASAFATELFVCLELSTNLAVPSVFTFLLHSRCLSQRVVDTYQEAYSST